jgi:signal transduction histidine kinase
LAWETVRWAAALGAGLSVVSLLLAGAIARQITRPIDELRRSFADVSGEPAKPISMGPPEIMQLQDSLYRATSDRVSANQALTAALSKLEQEMELREETQAALAQSQRMEAIGQLSGGMAHDFNNVLAAISGYLDVVTLRSSDEKTLEIAQGAMDAIQMGASLTRRLLTLSRRTAVGLETLNLNERTGAEAIILLETGKPVAIVFADIVMPGGMTGYDVAKWVRSRRPDLKVLLTSGYANPPAAARNGVQEVKVLGKPYTREQLARAVREALHGSIEGHKRSANGADVYGEPSTVIQLRRPQHLR